MTEAGTFIIAGLNAFVLHARDLGFFSSGTTFPSMDVLGQGSCTDAHQRFTLRLARRVDVEEAPGKALTIKRSCPSANSERFSLVGERMGSTAGLV